MSDKKKQTNKQTNKKNKSNSEQDMFKLSTKKYHQLYGIFCLSC